MLKPRKSPSNTYIAICFKGNFHGLYFRKFTMPENWAQKDTLPSWYFLNQLDLFACILDVCAVEDMHMKAVDVEDVGSRFPLPPCDENIL